MAAEILTSSNGYHGKTYTPTGPASISFNDVATGLSKALGKEIKYVSVPLEAGKQAMLNMGLPEWMVDAYSDYYKAYSEG